MIKLKTLKDLGIEHDNVCDVDTDEKIYTHVELKQEAIKWIKELDKKGDFYLKHQNKQKCNNSCYYDNILLEGFEYCNDDEKLPVQKFIKHFFNITDEDLKNE